MTWVTQIDPTSHSDLVDLLKRPDLEHSSEDRSYDKRPQRGVHVLKRLARELLSCTNLERERQLRIAFHETVSAIQNLSRSPIPEHVDFFETPWLFLKGLSRPVGHGNSVASNLSKTSDSDPSRADPLPSTFWERPANIAAQNLFYGPSRTNLLLDTQTVCEYAGPKDSFGRNPGFELERLGVPLKVKFAEVSSEPFASRIFCALGYHTDPTDYVPGVKVRYSRSLLTEFNSRRTLQTHFTFLKVIPLFTLNLQKHYDPFQYLVGATLKDGTHWSAPELRSRLFREPSLRHPEELSTNFRPEVEAEIDYVETVPANVQAKSGRSIGPWDFGQLDHAALRELRGAALLAGWLGWFDARFDNTRLRVVKDSGQPQLRHFFSDLGGVLGQTDGLLYSRGELPNSFPWSFTRPAPDSTKDPSATPFPLRGYKPIASCPAFAAMTLQDARWMGRLIGALSEAQITQALVASGFDSAQTRLYLEKLICRRDQMIRDLGLEKEFPLLRSNGVNRRFSDDPSVSGRISVDSGGNQVSAKNGLDRIVRGKLVKVARPTLLYSPKAPNRES